MTTGRRVLILGAVAAALLALGALAVVILRPPSPGPLQPTELVQSFGTTVEDGSTLSFVVELRGEVPVVATLDSVSLADADAGLTLTDSGIQTSGFTGYVVKSFPPGDLEPVAGTEVTTRPGDPSGDVFIALGIKTDLSRGRQSAHGVWLDYTAHGVRYRALLPWLLTVCPGPGTEPCPNQAPDSFTFPEVDR